MTEPTIVKMILDFGTGEHESVGRMYITKDGMRVFADQGGWCTQYVKHWEPIWREPEATSVMVTWKWTNMQFSANWPINYHEAEKCGYCMCLWVEHLMRRLGVDSIWANTKGLRR